jgi:hypothetical protein
MASQRIFLKFVCTLVIFIGALNTTALGIGTLRPRHPALEEFAIDCENQSEPCWNGIVPGMTTVNQASQMIHWELKAINSLPPESRWDFELPDAPAICRIVIEAIGDTIAWIRIQYCPDSSVRIGDVFAELGLPARILGANRELGYGGAQTNNFGWWSPFDQATAIGLMPSGINPDPVNWYGFIPKWRYCQVVADTPGC